MKILIGEELLWQLEKLVINFDLEKLSIKIGNHILFKMVKLDPIIMRKIKELYEK